MSAIFSKASALGTIITLAMVYMVSVSAQSSSQLPAAGNSLTTADSTPEKKSVPPGENSGLTAQPSEMSDVKPVSEGSDPITARPGTMVAAGAVNVGPSATMKSASPRPQTTSSDEWEIQFSPYFWLAGLHGRGGVFGRTADVDMSFGDVFGSLKFALMGVLQARKGRFVSLTDMEYVSIREDRATPGPFFSSVDAGFKTFIFDQEVGYRLYDDSDRGASVDVLGGIRVWHVGTDLDFGAGILPAQQIQDSRTWVDGILELRGKAAVSEKVFVTGKFDLGGGGSNFTWQFFGGAGYNIKPNIALIGGYRVLDVNYNKDNFIYDMNQRGPIIGLGFRF